MLTLQVKEKQIENLTPEEEFIRGTVGAECQINLDEFWQGYENTVVFKRENDCTVYNVAIDSLSNRVEIPYTILAESGSFKVGLFGVKPDEVLPTLWSDYIKVRYGTDTHGTTPPKYEPNEIDQLRLSKQDKLVSGENIKTVNGESVLGSGNIKIQVEVDQIYSPTSANAQSGKAVKEAVAPKADKTELNKLKEDLSNNRYEILNLSLNERLEGSANAKFFTTSVTAEGIELSSLNIRRLLFRIKYPSSDEYTGSTMFIAFNDMKNKCGTIAVQSNSVVCGEMEVIDRYNIYFPTPQKAALSYNSTNYQLSGVFLYDNLDKLGTDENKINSIQFYANYPNGTVLPAGTEIIIIGIAY